MTSNRIEQKFSVLRRRKQKALIVFITAGDPSLAVTEQLVLAFEKAGADIIELGVPFSDPLADGPTIQAASQRALKKNIALPAILRTVERIRRRSQIPIALMTYYNPVFHYSERRFLAMAGKAGVDGVIIPDLPPEEAGSLIAEARKRQLSTIFFLSPMTGRERTRRIVKASSGFLYYVSVTGVTGARRRLPRVIFDQVRAVKRMTLQPVCVGFGVSTPQQVRALARVADGVIVGSAVIKQIEKFQGSKALVENVARFVRTLKQGLK